VQKTQTLKTEGTKPFLTPLGKTPDFLRPPVSKSLKNQKQTDPPYFKPLLN